MHRITVGILLLVLSSLAAFAIVWTPSYAELLVWTARCNYWLIFAIFLTFVMVVFSNFRGKTASIRPWMRTHMVGLLLAVILGCLLQIHEPHRAKILYDEDVVCGTAYQMHEQRLAAFPSKMHYVDGEMTVTLSATDKRSPFFAFFLSLAHDLSGYRPQNVFVLNALLGGVLLFLLYLWTELVCGRVGSYAAMLLLASLPLLAQSATGAGVEVMNLVLVLAFALAARRYLCKSGSDGLNLFICIALMLALVRYESILYLATLALVVFIKWMRERRVTLTWFAVFSPLLAVPALVYIRIFNGDSHFAVIRTPGSSFYSLDYLPGNIGTAIVYLFSSPFSGLSNSVMLSLVGGIALLFLVVRLLSQLRCCKIWNESTIVFSSVLVTALLVTMVFLFSCWGTWDAPMLSRYSLSFQLMLVLAFAGVLPMVFGERVPLWIPFLFAAYLILFSLPQMSRHESTNTMDVSKDSAFFRNWANQNATVRDLFVDESAVGLMLDGHPAVSTFPVNQAPWKLQAILDAGVYDHVFVCQRVRLDFDGQWIPYTPEAFITDKLKLKPLAINHTRYGVVARICEVVSVDDSEIEKHKMPEDVASRARWFYEILP
jgi:hypothetical protein